MITLKHRRFVADALRLLLRTVRGFQRNQCLLLAGAIAYYGLLSVIALLVLAALAVGLYFIVDASLNRWLSWHPVTPETTDPD